MLNYTGSIILDMKKNKLDKQARKELLEQETLKLKVLREDVLNSISVIVQGKTMGLPGETYDKQLTLQCIQSIRNFLPNAEIILSTWEGSIVEHLWYDKVIFNQDPGAVPYTNEIPGFLNNNNRQIVSTINGLKAATKKYAIKMRGDCKLVDTDFINYLKDYPRGAQFNFFKQRIVISTKFSRNPRRIAQLIHPSDIFQVGLREDLTDLWDIPLQPEPQTTQAIPQEKKIFNNALTGGFHRMKFGAEQYNWYAFCKKHGLDLELKHYSHIPARKILASEQSIINNFVMEEPYRLGVLLPNRMFLQPDKDLYTHQEWYNLSKKYAAKASPFDEPALIARVYFSNVSKIVARIVHRLFKYGVGGFLKSLKHYLTK
jgi:hypothetical protein